jgi:hypothetical protein
LGANPMLPSVQFAGQSSLCATGPTPPPYEMEGIVAFAPTSQPQQSPKELMLSVVADREL